MATTRQRGANAAEEASYEEARPVDRYYACLPHCGCTACGGPLRNQWYQDGEKWMCRCGGQLWPMVKP
jgi:hypothetical protein